jgi:hypothetical protein
MFVQCLKKNKIKWTANDTTDGNANTRSNTWGIASKLMRLKPTVVNTQFKCVFTAQLLIVMSEYGTV